MRKLDQVGIVMRTEAGQAEVEIIRSTSCGERCSSCNIGCSGTGITVKVQNPVLAQVGDRVQIESKASSVVFSAVFVYLLPVIMMVVSMIYGGRLAAVISPDISSDAVGLISGVGALVVFYYLLKSADRVLTHSGRGRMEITRILNR